MKSNDSFDIHAGRLSLNFTNTVYERPGYSASKPQPVLELLNSPEDFLRWCTERKATSKATISALREGWESSKNTAEKDLRSLIELREKLFSLFYAQISKGRLSERQLSILNELLRTLPQRELYAKDSVLYLEWPKDLEPLRIIDATLILDAVELFTTEDLTRLKVCAAEDCGWLFLDRSKNGKRRWCDMTDCGNRAKQKSFYSRVAQEGRIN